jgi:hypothetical protein
VEHLTRDDGDGSVIYRHYRKIGAETPVAIIPDVWFNSEHPENHSAYIPNKNKNEASFCTHNQWQLDDLNQVGERIRECAYNIVVDHMRLPHNMARLPSHEINTLNNMLPVNLPHPDTKPYELDKVRLMMLSGSKMVKATKGK